MRSNRTGREGHRQDALIATRDVFVAEKCSVVIGVLVLRSAEGVCFLAWRRRVVLDPLVLLPRQHPLRNRNADLLRRFEIDDELEFDRLLEGNIGWFDAVEMLST